MRLRYGELSERERAQRARVCSEADRAWRLLAQGDVEAARAVLVELDERLTLEVTAGDAEQVSLAQLAVDESGAWPLAELVLECAPPDLGHALALGRAPLELTRALGEVERVHGVDLSRASLRAGFSRGHLLELTLGVPGGSGAKIEQIAAENLVCRVLGQRTFETWIGAVHVSPAPRGGPLRVLDSRAPQTGLRITELVETVAAAVLGVQRGLPERSWVTHASSVGASSTNAADAPGDWTMLEVEPMPDARGVDKDDLLLASTCTPELLRCYLDGSPCSSRRFSRHGERFVFVAYADVAPSPAERVERRSRIEAELAECLVGVGAVTGVGLGVRTSYVDLALCNLETGLGRLVAKLRDLELPDRCIIQFFDSELSEEWLSISRGSPLTRG